MIKKTEIISKANNGSVEKSPKSNPSSTDKRRVNTTTVKVSVMWLFISDYLEMLNSTGAVFDEEFARRFKSLLDYVNGKIDFSNFKNVLDEYVVFEVEM